MSSANFNMPPQATTGAPAGGKRPPVGGGGGNPIQGQTPQFSTGGPQVAHRPAPSPLADLRQRNPSAYGIYMSQNPSDAATGSSSYGNYNFSQPGARPSPPGGGLSLSTGGQPGGSASPIVGQPPATPPMNFGNDMIPGQPPGAPDPFSQPTSAMDVYRSAVPVMKQDLQDRLSDAMAGAGFSGNRFGSYAMKTAAEEGARTGLQQNQLMTNLLHRQTNTDLDRALQAANMGSQHGQAANQMQLDRMRFLADQGRWEQGRQDLFERQRYEDFERNKLGFLPMLMQMAQSPGSPTSGVWGNQQSGGSPGLLDWATLAAQIYGASQ